VKTYITPNQEPHPLSVFNEQKEESQLNNKLISLKRKNQLNKIITYANGKPDHLAINIYWDFLRSWHNPTKKYSKGNIIHLSKLKQNGIYTCYKQLAEDYVCSEDTIRRKLVRLEKLGLISRDWEIIKHYTKILYNQLVIYVWQETPHFFNAFGIARIKKTVTNLYTNYGYISSKNCILPIQQNVHTSASKKLDRYPYSVGYKKLSTELSKEEIDNISTKDILSISEKEKINKKEKDKIAFTENLETITSKPRIRVAAISERIYTTSLEQSNLLCSPCGAASQISSAKKEEDTICLTDIPTNQDINPFETDTGFTSLMEIIAKTSIVAEGSFVAANDQTYTEPAFHKHSYEAITTSNTEPTSFSSQKERFTHDLNVRKIKVKIRDLFEDKSQAEELVLKLKIEQPIPGRIKLTFPRDITLKLDERYKLRSIIMNVCGRDINIVSNLKVSAASVTETFDNNIAYDACYVPIAQKIKAIGEESKAERMDQPATIIPIQTLNTELEENMQKAEDVQLKVENSPQISWHRVKEILSTHQKFYRLDNVFVAETLRKITISHDYGSRLVQIQDELGVDLSKIAKEFNILIVLKNKYGDEVCKYNPDEQKYIPTNEDMKQSFEENKYSALKDPRNQEMVERLNEMIGQGFLNNIEGNNSD